MNTRSHHSLFCSSLVCSLFMFAICSVFIFAGLGTLFAQSPGTVKDKNIPGSGIMRFAYVPAGRFDMGDQENSPAHRVIITKGFWIGVTEVTQGQWKGVMGALPKRCSTGNLNATFFGDTKPVVCVNWF